MYIMESSKTRDFWPACPESILRVCNEFESPFWENTVWLNWYDLSPFGARWNTPEVTLSTKNVKSELPLGDAAEPVRITWTYTAVPGECSEMFGRRVTTLEKLTDEWHGCRYYLSRNVVRSLSGWEE